MARSTVTSLLTLVRYTLLSIILAINIAVLVLSASLFAIETDSNIYRPIIPFLIFLGAFSIVFILPTILIDVYRQGPVLGKMIFEICWLSVFWVMHLAGASALTASPHCGLSAACGSINSTLIPLEWLAVSILLLHLALLLVSTLENSGKFPDVWRRGIRDAEWPEDKAEQPSSSESSPIAPREEKPSQPGPIQLDDPTLGQMLKLRSAWEALFTLHRGHDSRATSKAAPQPSVDASASSARLPFQQEPYPFSTSAAVSETRPSIEPASQLSPLQTPPAAEAGPSRLTREPPSASLQTAAFVFQEVRPTTRRNSRRRVSNQVSEYAENPDLSRQRSSRPLSRPVGPREEGSASLNPRDPAHLRLSTIASGSSAVHDPSDLQNPETVVDVGLMNRYTNPSDLPSESELRSPGRIRPLPKAQSFAVASVRGSDSMVTSGRLRTLPVPGIDSSGNHLIPRSPQPSQS